MKGNHLAVYDNYFSPEDERRDMLPVVDIGRVAVGYSCEAAQPDDASASRGTVIIGSGSIDPLADVLDQHRAKFVRDMGWMPSDHMTDVDEYDDPAMWTFSFVDILREEDGEDVIISSLRLTRLDRLEDCMSLQMVSVESRDDLPPEVLPEITRAEKTGMLYDLTRLLPPSKKTVPMGEYFESVTKLIGYGVEHTATRPDADPVWLFATPLGMHDKLERLGMPNEVIATCRRPGEPRTALCFVKPRKALEFLSDNRDVYPATFRSVQQGIVEAGRTLSV